jgi:AAA family ATP:ADP antiporter
LTALPDIRASERRNVIGAFLTLFGVLAAHVVTETARDALFLSRLPAQQLPWVYLAIAVIAALVARPRAGAREVGQGALGSWLLASSAITVGFWLLAAPDRPWALYLLYAWSGVFGTLTLTWFWLLLGELFTVTEAKRLYGAIGAGAVVGAVAGAGLASLLARAFPAEHLLLASASLLAVTAAAPALILRRPTDAPPRRPPATVPEVRLCARTVIRTRYIRRLAGLVIISTLTLSIVDYVFKVTVAAEVPPDELGAWFATFYLALNALALVAQVLVTGAVMRHLGVHRALLFLPLLLLGGAAAVFIVGGLVGALILKGADGSLRHSLHRTSTELLFLPIPERLRRHSKAFIDVLLQRSAQAVASLAILLAVAAGASTTALVAVTAALAGIWLVAAVSLRPHYLEMFRVSLRQGSIDTSRELPELDISSLEALMRALNHDDAEVIAAMEILAREGRTDLIPALILHHPAEEVVLRALDLFAKAGRGDFVPVADRLLASDPRPRIRAAAMRARHAVAPDPTRLRAYTDDRDALVRTTACASLLSTATLDGAEARMALDACRRGATVDEHVAVLSAIALQPLRAFEAVVLDLGAHPERAVQLAAADAMGAVDSPTMLPALVAMLGERALRLRARDALLRHGDDALAHLRAALADLTLPDAVRVHIPRTISRFGGQAAVDILTARLRDEPTEIVRFKILRGLGRLVTDGAQLSVDRATLRAALDRDLAAAFTLLHQQRVLADGLAEDPARATSGHELLSTLVRDKLVHATERVFRLFGLLHRSEDFQTLYRSAIGASRARRANAFELLEHVVDADVREPLLALVSDAPLDVRLAAGGPLLGAVPEGYEALLASLAAGSSATLAALAAYHRRELGLAAAPLAPAPWRAPRTAARDGGGVLASLLGQEPAHVR